MKGYKRFINSLESSIKTVDEALNHGVLLTRMEKFDYDFKKALYLSCFKSKEIKKDFVGSLLNKDTKLAQVYANTLNSLVCLANKGFSYKEAVNFAEDIVRKCNLYGLNKESVSVQAEDLNGVLYVKVFDRREMVATLEVNNVYSLFMSMLAIISHIGEMYTEDTEFKDFISSYLLNVFKDIKAGKTSKPYIYKDMAKTLGNYISKKDTVVSKENSKIIMLGSAV